MKLLKFLLLPYMAAVVAAIVRDLELRRPIYKETARHGHFGRELPSFTWEKTDKADTLRTIAEDYVNLPRDEQLPSFLAQVALVADVDEYSTQTVDEAVFRGLVFGWLLVLGPTTAPEALEVDAVVLADPFAQRLVPEGVPVQERRRSVVLDASCVR